MLPPLGQLPINAFLSSSDFENSPPSFQFESVDDELTRFASMLCYTEEMADALYNDITHSLTMTGYIQGEICQDAHSYELGWVTSSYQLIQTEHVWQIEVIVKTRSYPTAAMAWAMGGNEWHTSRGSVFVDVVGVEEEAKDKINDAMPKSPERFHSTESEDLFKQRDLKRKLAEINRNLRYVEGEKHTHLTDKLSDLPTDLYVCVVCTLPSHLSCPRATRAAIYADAECRKRFDNVRTGAFLVMFLLDFWRVVRFLVSDIPRAC